MERNCLTAEELSQLVGVSVLLAKERWGIQYGDDSDNEHDDNDGDCCFVVHSAFPLINTKNTSSALSSAFLVFISALVSFC